MEWLGAEQLWLGRWLLTRALGAIYLIAFLVAFNQWRALNGSDGLLPVTRTLRATSWRSSPSLFHWRYSDTFADGLAVVGIALASGAVVGVPQSLPIWASMLWWLALWVAYSSFVNVGGLWYAFGWETLTLEAGFLAIFLGPDHIAPPVITMWLFRWLLFRVEFGAGLIKIRGDQCWRDLTCLDYHHETQPMPSLFSWYFHHLPRWAHKVETGTNHVVQLVVPFLVFAPQPVASAAALAIIVTQSWLVISGNFAWLNAITIVLAFSALDVDWLRWLPAEVPAALDDPPAWFGGFVIALAVVVAVLSFNVVRNLLSRGQLMNASFDPLRLVNTYGAFGSITRTRYELVFEGRDADGAWREYGFKGKPTRPDRRPPQIAPYHLRLDWLLWFAAFGPSPGPRDRWILPFVERLLDADEQTLKLLRVDPFDGRPPGSVRVRRFRYRYATPAERRETGDWWIREDPTSYLPELTLDRLREASPQR